MTKIKLFSFLILFLLCRWTCELAIADSFNHKALKLEGMNYHSARNIILSYGWSPLLSPCEQISSNTCSQFPEIGSCSGVDPGYCSMVFIKKDRCLYVVTVGGEPEADRDGETRIKTVTFRSSPCLKN